MQSLDIISVNIWQIVASLLNLVILFLLVKKFLYQPVQKVLEARRSSIDREYSEAEDYKQQAMLDKQSYEEKLATADAQAEALLQSAAERARHREDALISDARQKAEGIVRMAQTEAELERKKAVDGIKREIVEVSGTLTEKLLEREVNTEDHRSLIDSFIEKIGDGDD